NVVKEVNEEAGLVVEAKRVLAIFDKHKNNNAKSAHRVTKFFILCRLHGGEIQPNYETVASGFFSLDYLPPLYIGKNTAEHL
ncbi:ADP-ribose pyrophosphatase, partial [Streptococcus suis]